MKPVKQKNDGDILSEHVSKKIRVYLKVEKYTEYVVNDRSWKVLVIKWKEFPYVIK